MARSAIPQLHAANRGRMPLGFNVIGYVSSNSGLGVSARHIDQALARSGAIRLQFSTSIQAAGRGRHDLSFDAYSAKSPVDLPYDINLAVLAIPSLPSFFLDPPAVLGSKESLQPGSHYWLADNRLNVAVVWWELAVLPDSWIRGARGL